MQTSTRGALHDKLVFGEFSLVLRIAAQYTKINVLVRWLCGAIIFLNVFSVLYIKRWESKLQTRLSIYLIETFVLCSRLIPIIQFRFHRAYEIAPLIFYNLFSNIVSRIELVEQTSGGEISYDMTCKTEDSKAMNPFDITLSNGVYMGFVSLYTLILPEILLLHSCTSLQNPSQVFWNRYLSSRSSRLMLYEYGFMVGLWNQHRNAGKLLCIVNYNLKIIVFLRVGSYFLEFVFRAPKCSGTARSGESHLSLQKCSHMATRVQPLPEKSYSLHSHSRGVFTKSRGREANIRRSNRLGKHGGFT